MIKWTTWNLDTEEKAEMLNKQQTLTEWLRSGARDPLYLEAPGDQVSLNKWPCSIVAHFPRENIAYLYGARMLLVYRERRSPDRAAEPEFIGAWKKDTNEFLQMTPAWSAFEDDMSEPPLEACEEIAVKYAAGRILSYHLVSAVTSDWHDLVSSGIGNCYSHQNALCLVLGETARFLSGLKPGEFSIHAYDNWEKLQAEAYCREFLTVPNTHLADALEDAVRTAAIVAEYWLTANNPEILSLEKKLKAIRLFLFGGGRELLAANAARLVSVLGQIHAESVRVQTGPDDNGDVQRHSVKVRRLHQAVARSHGGLHSLPILPYQEAIYLDEIERISYRGEVLYRR